MSFSASGNISRAMLLLFAVSCFPHAYVSAQHTSDRSVSATLKNNRDNTPRSIRFSESPGYHAADAQAIFTKYLGVNGSDNRMVFANTTKTKSSLTHYKYEQWYKGIKISYASYTLTVKDNIVRFMTGNVYKTENAGPAVPALSEHQAFDKALASVGAQKYMWQDASSEQFIKARYHNPDTTYLPKGQLTWIEDFTEKTDDRALHLAYSFDIYARAPLSRQVVYVDAASGKILLSNSLIRHTAASGQSLYSGVVPFQSAHVGANYILYDSTRGDGVHTLNMHNGTDYTAATEFTSATNTWPAAAADTQSLDAQWGASRVYDYWDTVQGRLSWDNMNGILLQYVHYNTAYDNAFWDGQEMNYGDGSGCGAGGFTPLVSLDVTAHEIGHGVCQATCNLIYAGESGGLDEGLSDCWGATIENWANPHEVDAVPKQTWKMGEEIGCGSPLRSLDFPKLEGLPDTYLGINWVDVVGCTPSGFNDQCGVHTNMGVISKWYYLLTEGGSGTNDLGHAYSVTGLGFTESENILYQTELVMPSNADYPATRAASIEVATTIYGPCSPEVEAVTTAWYAVGVGTIFDPCVPQISFVNTASTVTENANTNSCTASHIEKIPIKETGPAITGGTPTATIVAIDGTAVSGVDYLLTPTTLSFAPGDTTTQYISVTIYDNGAVAVNKSFRLAFTFDAMGTTTIMSPVADTDVVTIGNDDFAPQPGGAEYHTVNTVNITSNHTSPFYGGADKAHSQFMLYPADLIASGLRPNYPISAVAFNVTSKATTQPYTNYTMSFGNTTVADLSTNFITTGLTTVYSGNYTTSLGEDSIEFSTPFVWDGVSNIIMDVCFTNTSAATANDKVDGVIGGNTVCAYSYASTGTGTGCSLPYNGMQTSTAVPIMRFSQIIAPGKVETTVAATRTWYVKSGQDVFFYALADTGVIMGLNNPSMDLGCVNTTLTAEGNGFTPFSYTSGVNRSVKEFSVTPAENGTATSYDATLYFTNTELATGIPGNMYIFKTDAATDAAIDVTNSALAHPVLMAGENYYGFTGTFTGFSRFFLVDSPIPGLTAVTNVANADNTIKVDNNPFHDRIYVSYSIGDNMSASVKLFDVIGRIIYSSVNDLARGNHKFTIDCSVLNLPTGTYIMQVTTSENVYTRKLLKD